MVQLKEGQKSRRETRIKKARSICHVDLGHHEVRFLGGRSAIENIPDDDIRRHVNASGLGDVGISEV